MKNPVKAVLAKSRGAFIASAIFSCAINILMLTGPIFMLQIYDRVLTSRSVPTLIALFILVAGLYLFLGLFDVVRAKVLSRIAFRLDWQLSNIANRAWIFSRLAKHQTKIRPLNDLSNIRQFMTSNGLPALFDLPWIPVYLLIVYLLHVWLGLLATFGAIIVIISTVVGELITKQPITQSTMWNVKDQTMAESSNRNADAIVAMGMVGNVTHYWSLIRQKALINSQKAGARAESISAITKTTRLFLQSAILALGAYLAIYQEITPGTMIAASILAGRALAPIDAAVGNWKNFVRARFSYFHLQKFLGNNFEPKETIDLPKPQGKLEVTNIVKIITAKTNGGEPRTILNGINFSLNPGDGLGVIGPSACGKTSLGKLLVGLWMAERGEVRFDGATFDQWEKDKVGKHIGYLPQSVEISQGTIAQNIARFELEAKDENIVQAAQLAGVHELILKLPNGYATNLSEQETVLSGGQSQRIALARAVYGLPSLVVLDEPNANLDMEGDQALSRTIALLRKAGSCVVVMAHRPSAISSVNKLLAMKDGKQIKFGEKDEVLQQITKRPQTL